MTKRTTFSGAAIAVAILSSCVLASPWAVRNATAEESECFPVSTLKHSFQVVFPNARQVTMDGDAAKSYLREYNSFGRPTKFTGDTLFMNILPNGTTMLIPLNDGIGCNRMIVGPTLHKVIMARVARGAI